MAVTIGATETPRDLRRRAAELVQKAKDLRSAAEALPEAERAPKWAEFDAAMSDYQQLREAAEQRERDEQSRNDADAAERRRKAIEDAEAEQQRRRDTQGDNPHTDPSNTRGGVHQYSLLRAVRLLADGRRLDGIEGETQAELVKRRKSDPDEVRRTSKRDPDRPDLLIIPTDTLTVDLHRINDARAAYGMPSRRTAEQRAALSTVTGAGVLVTTTEPTMIDFLSAQLVVRAMGATVLTGLVGTVNFPKKTQRGTAYWLAEGQEPTVSNVTVGQIDMAPTTVGMAEQYTRRFLMQTTIDAEQLLRADITEVIAEAIDVAALIGSGSSNQPEGIVTDTDVPSIAMGTNGAAATRRTFIDIFSTLGTNHALRDAARLGILTTFPAWAKLSDTEVSTGTGRYILEDDRILNMPVRATTMLPSNGTKGTGTNLSTLVAGDWRELMIGFWSGLDILVNPYSPLARSGGVELDAFQDCDVERRQPKAFVKITDLVTT